MSILNVDYSYRVFDTLLKRLNVDIQLQVVFCIFFVVDNYIHNDCGLRWYHRNSEADSVWRSVVLSSPSWMNQSVSWFDIEKTSRFHTHTFRLRDWLRLWSWKTVEGAPPFPREFIQSSNHCSFSQRITVHSIIESPSCSGHQQATCKQIDRSFSHRITVY